MGTDSLATVAHMIASTGPVTAFGEAAATSIAAGAFLGGFAAGAAGFVLARKDAWRDRATVNGSYLGGTTMIAALAVESILR